ncbi:unnamed protein product [Thlaspi arvense]|uniref:RING-type domain-containing protein n=1 Tax=Thlaspi arvense TaxID=13288 RepID=A0AAU9SM98_THLAR|nr:unnamed protein product [Thlaspi arvense]
MGNKLGRKRQVVEERYTKPQGLYVNKDVDVKKLRKLIVESKLAPCYPGDDESCHDLEECPICFLYYPSLNRSRCCMKSICTECFLQMKNPNSARPTQCPFCKTPNYAVEYRGVKSKEEKGIEQVEEQRVIEAKIRMRQKEMQDDEEKMQKRMESCSSSTSAMTGEMEYGSASAISYNSPMEDAENDPSQNVSVVRQQRSHPRGNRDDEIDVDLEELMVMEAIWLSIQETGMPRNNTACGEMTPFRQYVPEDHSYVSSPPRVAPVAEPETPSSSSGGLACGVAALAERQQMVGESSNHSHNHNHNVNVSSYSMLPGNCDSYYDIEQEVDDIDNHHHHHHHYHNNHTEMGGETGSNSYVSSYMNGQSFHNFPPPPPLVIVPESFEEQMMMAMAVSLAEVHATTTSAPTEVTWQ